MPNILSEDQIERFEAEGYLAPIRVLSEPEMARYVRSLEAFEANYPADASKLRLKANLLCPWIDELTRHPIILDLLEDLLGPNLLCWSPGFKTKNPDGRTYAGWHQDSTYIGVEPRYTLATLAFTEHTPESGCVRMMPGSHKWGQLPHADHELGDCLLSRNYATTVDLDESQAVDIVLRPGEISIHDGMVLHCSGPNFANFRRISLISDYVPSHAQQTGGLRESAMLVRGVDEYRRFDEDPRPAREMSPATLAAWHAATDAQISRIFEGSDTTPHVYR